MRAAREAAAAGLSGAGSSHDERGPQVPNRNRPSINPARKKSRKRTTDYTDHTDKRRKDALANSARSPFLSLSFLSVLSVSSGVYSLSFRGNCRRKKKGVQGADV